MAQNYSKSFNVRLGHLAQAEQLLLQAGYRLEMPSTQGGWWVEGYEGWNFLPLDGMGRVHIAAPAPSGQAFHRLLLGAGLIQPRSKRDRNFLARLSRQE